MSCSRPAPSLRHAIPIVIERTRSFRTRTSGANLLDELDANPSGREPGANPGRSFLRREPSDANLSDANLRTRTSSGAILPDANLDANLRRDPSGREPLGREPRARSFGREPFGRDPLGREPSARTFGANPRREPSDANPPTRTLRARSFRTRTLGRDPFLTRSSRTRRATFRCCLTHPRCTSADTSKNYQEASRGKGTSRCRCIEESDAKISLHRGRRLAEHGRMAHLSDHHCRGCWAIVLAGEEGKALEEKVGPHRAGMLIYGCSTGNVPLLLRQQ